MTMLSPMLTPAQLADEIKRRARALGFDLVGICDASPSRYRDYFRRWLDQGRAGTMNYLAGRFEEKTDVTRYMPGARSVICVAMNYYVPLERADPSANHVKVARYALGDDYHEVIKPRLHQIADWLREAAPEARTRCAVDTAPLMEKELAARAGIGWLARNTCIVNPQIGSWLLLGEIVTTLELPADPPATDHCGTCTRCIDACPTQAITAPYQLDATRCISYLTIEHRGEITETIGNWAYGCDICQDVCPWNSKAPSTALLEMQPRFPSGTLDARDVAAWDDDAYRRTLRGSAMKRVKLPILHRNAKLAAT